MQAVPEDPNPIDPQAAHPAPELKDALRLAPPKEE